LCCPPVINDPVGSANELCASSGKRGACPRAEARARFHLFPVFCKKVLTPRIQATLFLYLFSHVSRLSQYHRGLKQNTTVFSGKRLTRRAAANHGLFEASPTPTDTSVKDFKHVLGRSETAATSVASFVQRLLCSHNRCKAPSAANRAALADTEPRVANTNQRGR